MLAIKVNYFGNTAARARLRVQRGSTAEIANAALTIGSILFDFDAVQRAIHSL